MYILTPAHNPHNAHFPYAIMAYDQQRGTATILSAFRSPTEAIDYLFDLDFGDLPELLGHTPENTDIATIDDFLAMINSAGAHS